MQTAPRVIVKPRKARPFFARHPWLFAGAIDRIEGDPVDGGLVAVHAHDGPFIAWGLFNWRSQIRVRLYSWSVDEPLDDSLLASRIDRAIRFRRHTLGLAESSACRLVFSESDGLSGLIVDRYGEWLVVQFTALALARRQDAIVQHLVQQCQPRGVYRRTERGVGEAEGLNLQDGPLWGDVPHEPVRIVEHDLTYEIALTTGQKTGFYLDQRDNRMAVRRYAAARRALDVCAYTGGFSLSLARGGATEVVGIDVSNAAVESARRNAEINGVGNVRFEVGDCFKRLDEFAARGERFGLIVLDPPRFTRSRSSIDQAIRGYIRLNRLALAVLADDGILISNSCSGQVTREDFAGVLAAAAEQSKCGLQFIEQRGQAPDHPISAACLETSYLKCFVCRIMR